MLVQLLSILALFLGTNCNEDFPVIEILLGQVRGSYKKSFEGQEFAAFEGIPFAKPPIGERRFEEAEPIKPWHGVWNATQDTQCAQTSIMPPYNTVSGDEDCLYINVYVPTRKLVTNANLDVIVHIHGGGYLWGSGNSYTRPDFFMDHDVIYVSFNYRLGILGFLSTEDDTIPGNNGLKDQVLALKWIQHNIVFFGGNPRSVTITGLSAGASSVHLHYLSKLSKNLFHGGFSISGHALTPWTIQKNPLIKTKKIAAAVGCPTSDTKIMVKCLKKKPLKQLLEQLTELYAYRFLPGVPLGPVVEKGGAAPFLTADPYHLLNNGEVHDVPWIASLSVHEGTSPVMMFADDLDNIDVQWKELAPYLLDFNHTLPPPSWEKAAKEIKQFYLGDSKINQENILKIIQMFSDRNYFANAGPALQLQAKANKSPVYFYFFGYPGDNNEQKLVGHCSDAKYYYTSVLTPTPLTENELKMKDTLMKMLILFAKRGKVVIDGVEWKPTTYDELRYLKVDGFEASEMKMEKTEELGNRSFWKSLNLMEGENLSNIKDEL